MPSSLARRCVPHTFLVLCRAPVCHQLGRLDEDVLRRARVSYDQARKGAGGQTATKYKADADVLAMRPVSPTRVQKPVEKRKAEDTTAPPPTPPSKLLKLKCHKCGELGHFARNCPKSNKGKKDEQ